MFSRDDLFKKGFLVTALILTLGWSILIDRPGSFAGTVKEAGAASNELYKEIYDQLLDMVSSEKPHPITKSSKVLNIIAALAAVNPDKGLDLAKNLDKIYRGSNPDRIKMVAAQYLARVFQGPRRKEIAGIFSDNPKSAMSFAFALFASNVDDLVMVAELVDPETPIGSLALLLAARELKSQGKDWEKALTLAKNQGQDLPEGHQLAMVLRLARASLTADPKPFDQSMKLLSEAGSEQEKMRIISGILSPLQIWNARRISGRTHHIQDYARAVCQASDSLPSDETAFSLLGLTAREFNQDPPEFLAARLKKRLPKDFLKGEMGPRHTIAFFSLAAMSSVDESWAAGLADELVASILSQNAPSSYYHMIGTIAGVLAGMDIDRAKETARKIQSLEWYFNALRCIYREWAKKAPEKAVKAAQEEDFKGEKSSTQAMHLDLTLEAALGAALVKPVFAADEILRLPDNRIRFTQGICLIAPPLAKVDLKRAVLLLKTTSPRTMKIEAIMALSYILLNHQGVVLDPAAPDFFPDFMLPRNRWPGPRLSQPVRFLIP